jgi:threonine/homoserine/homoserine lactone efflux protein
MMHTVVAFAALSVFVAITPGPDSLLVVRTSVRAGRRAGARVAGGAASGSLAWGICSAAGLTAILAASAQAYRAVQLAGAAYLVFLGTRSWRESARPSEWDSPRQRSWSGGFRDGLLSNLLNPKVGLFFLAVVPQLIPNHAHVAGYVLAFAATDAVIAAAWLTVIAWISDRARSLLRVPRVRAALDRVAASVLVAMGLKVAARQLI